MFLCEPAFSGLRQRQKCHHAARGCDECITLSNTERFFPPCLALLLVKNFYISTASGTCLNWFYSWIMQHYSVVLGGWGYSQGMVSITQDCRRPGAKSERTARISPWLSCCGVFEQSLSRGPVSSLSHPSPLSAGCFNNGSTVPQGA